MNNYWNYPFSLYLYYFDYLLDDRFLNYSFNLNNYLFFISFNEYFLNLFVWFGYLLNQSYLSLNWDLDYLLLYCSCLNYFFDCLNNLHRFLNCIGHSNWNLFFDLNYLRKRNKVINNLLDFHEFGYLYWDLFNNFNFF